MRAPAPAAREGVVGTALPLGVLVVAVVLVALGAPVALRSLVALPALLLVAGTSATRLLLGPRTPVADADPDETDATGATGGVVGTARDGVLRGSLAVVLGMLVLLASVLVAQTLGVPVAGASVLVGVAVAALGLLLASRLRRSVPVVPAGPLLRRPWVRPALGATVAVVVLVGAVALAASLPTPVTERYTVLALTGTQPWSADSLSAAPGADVSLDVALSSYGGPLGSGVPVTTVTVAGGSPGGLRVGWQPVEAGLSPSDGTVAGAMEQRTGTLTFRAPRDPGLYPVEVRAGTDGADPLLLTTYLQVTS